MPELFAELEVAFVVVGSVLRAILDGHGSGRVSHKLTGFAEDKNSLLIVYRDRGGVLFGSGNESFLSKKSAIEKSQKDQKTQHYFFHGAILSQEQSSASDSFTQPCKGLALEISLINKK